MKTRGCLAIFLVLLLTILLLFFSGFISESINEQLTQKQDVNTETEANIKSLEEKPYANDEIKRLTLLHHQCKNPAVDFSSQVENIHRGVIEAMEQELKRGVTERELLAYRGQYETWYNGYDNLLLSAKVNIERSRYDYTTSASILNDWKGLSVISGFSFINIPIIVEALNSIEGVNTGLRMQVALEDDIDDAQIYELLENEDNFNTYFESPLNIAAHPVISPSILFVLAAEQLPSEEFTQAISRQSFTVNDIAVAIQNDLAIEYLTPLLEITPGLENFPVFIHDRFATYSNLADIAAARHNVAVLSLLKTYGVLPINEEGIRTGLDIAISHLPEKEADYTDPESFPTKYIDTLKWLKAHGYSAHGAAIKFSDEEDISFRAQGLKSVLTNQVHNPQLKAFLYTLNLIGRDADIPQIASDGSPVSLALAKLQQQKEAVQENSERCQKIQQDLLSTQGFIDIYQASQMVENIMKENDDVAQHLHDSDPVLVNVLQRLEANQYATTADERSDFVKMLRDNHYEQALQYAVENPLNQEETDHLLYEFHDDLQQALAIWHARMSAIPPSNLHTFSRLSLEQWQDLVDGNFNLGMQDKYGGEIFVPAFIHSREAMEFLIEQGYKPNMEALGVDVFDLALEDSYEQGKLNSMLDIILPLVIQPEPGHYARIARLKQFYPAEYQKLIAKDSRLVPPEDTEINRYRAKKLPMMRD